jgi:kynurenine formamidase
MFRRMISVALVLISLAGGLQGQEKNRSASTTTLEDLARGTAKIMDLTYPLNEKTNYWPGEKYTPFKLETIATLEKDGVLSKAFSMPEHMGTHIDAPSHFEPNQPGVDRIDPKDMFAPGVVIDVRGPVASDSDYELTRNDVIAWERQNGRVPDGAVVMLHSGWGRFWDAPVQFQNKDVQGRLHFPGYSAEAARLLVRERRVRGLGIDTLSIDRGLSRDFAVHHIVNRAGRYGLENVANLDKLPVKGFVLVIAPIKIEGGSGGPARIMAILP